jgi:hypothetical protein
MIPGIVLTVIQAIKAALERRRPPPGGAACPR